MNIMKAWFIFQFSSKWRQKHVPHFPILFFNANITFSIKIETKQSAWYANCKAHQYFTSFNDKFLPFPYKVCNSVVENRYQMPAFISAWVVILIPKYKWLHKFTEKITTLLKQNYLKIKSDLNQLKRSFYGILQPGKFLKYQEKIKTHKFNRRIS